MTDESMVHEKLMGELQQKHGTLVELMGTSRLHYLDIPFHGNVGDLLIMLGSWRFFQKNKANVVAVSAYFNFNSAKVRPGDVILFHGGGNFGDIYGPFQKFREAVVADFPKNRIVLMPQSIHFSSQAALRQCADIFRGHQDLHIFVRDQESFEVARHMTQNVYLAPDMAHHLWPIASMTSPIYKELLLLRRDDEKGAESDSAVDSFDWDDVVNATWRFFMSQIVERSVTQFKLRFGLGWLFGNWFAKLWIWQSERFVEKAIKKFSQYETVRSDRLHAHILSMLMSKPNRIMDNSYGKNSRYINCWTKASPLVVLQKSEGKI
ncbi:MAG: polysaccharide pyruvyl transferase family protein [Pseudomonadota bacterium]